MITINDYIKDLEEQNIFLLNEISKYPNNSKTYKLRFMQYQTNIINIKMNKKINMVLAGQIID